MRINPDAVHVICLDAPDGTVVWTGEDWAQDKRRAAVLTYARAINEWAAMPPAEKAAARLRRVYCDAFDTSTLTYGVLIMGCRCYPITSQFKVERVLPDFTILARRRQPIRTHKRWFSPVPLWPQEIVELW